MPCPNWELIEALATGRLPAPMATTLDAHLHQCDTCSARVEEVRRKSGPPPEAPFQPDASTPTPTSATRDAGAPHPAPSVDLQRGASVGRYLILEPLGRGGMGAVYAAYDPELDRRVAIKLLTARREEGQWRTLLMREAQAMAQLRHPNVVAVYDAGTFGDSVFLAMELVEGCTLSQWLRQEERGWREVVQVFLQVGRGLSAAHAQGLIHRDVKPANILVGQDGSARLSDFGVARRVHSADDQVLPRMAYGLGVPSAPEPALTWAGALVGTLAYMAPEQLLHQAADARTDQFSFCAAMYEALFGKLPFGTAQRPPETEAPVPPADSEVPAWVRRIVMRGLSVAPEQRHPSLEALVAKLERDPAVTRRKWLVRLGAAAMVAGLLAVTGLSFRALQTARLASQFGKEVEAIETRLRLAHMRPEHDLGAEKAVVRAKMKGVAERMAAVGGAAQGPGHYALGRGHLALGEVERARAELDEAWKYDYREPEVAYALGQVLGLQYREALEEVERIKNAKERERRRREVEASYRDPALAYLQQSRGLDVESPEYVEALIAFYEKRYDEAVQKARTAYASVGWLYEAKTLEGTILMLMGNDRNRHGKQEEAVQSYTRAEAAFREATAIGRSDPSAHQALCELQTWLMHMKLYTGGAEVGGHFQTGIEACERALRIDAETTEAYRSKSVLLCRMAEKEFYSGKDPREKLDSSIAASQQALRLRPNHAMTYFNMGIAYVMRGSYEVQNGLDPRASLDGSLEAQATALELNPTAYTFKDAMGSVYNIKAHYEINHDLDPRESVSKGVEYYRAALALVPEYDITWYNLGLIHMPRAEYEADHGLDPRETLAQAMEAFTSSLRINPNYIYATNGLARAHLIRSEYEVTIGADPEEGYEKALQLYDAALAVNPKDAWIIGNAAHSWCARARRQIDRGQDPRAALERGQELARRTLEVNYTAGLNAQACLAVAEARWRVGRGLSPESLLAAGREAAERAWAKNPTSTAAPGWLAEIYRRLAAWRVSQGKDASREIAKGLAVIDKILAATPQDGHAMARRGALYLERARAAGPSERAASLGKAEEALAQALTMNRNLGHEFGPVLEEVRRARAGAGR